MINSKLCEFLNSKFKGMVIILFGFLTGCNQATVDDFSNPAIDMFYANYSLDAGNIKKYIFDETLVAPYFIPRYNYESHDLAVSVFSRSGGKKITINRVTISGIGTLYDGEEVMEMKEPYKSLFRNDRILVKNMVTNDILKVAGGKKEFIVNVDVSNQGKKQTLSYPFFVKKKTIAAPVR